MTAHDKAASADLWLIVLVQLMLVHWAFGLNGVRLVIGLAVLVTLLNRNTWCDLRGLWTYRKEI